MVPRRPVPLGRSTIHERAVAWRLRKDGREKKVSVRVAGQVRDFGAEEILIATGREAQIDALNLPAAGVETEHGRVRIDEAPTHVPRDDGGPPGVGPSPEAEGSSRTSLRY